MALGGALGSVARYLVAVGAAAGGEPTFPWATLLVNVLGSWAIAFYASMTGPEGPLFASLETRHFFTTGLCGGFTTFSIFSLESLLLLEEGHLLLAGAYVAASLFLWVPAALAGRRAAGRLLARRENPQL